MSRERYHQHSIQTVPTVKDNPPPAAPAKKEEAKTPAPQTLLLEIDRLKGNRNDE